MNWQDMNVLAGRMAPLQEWRYDLARRVRELARCETVAVATCPPGDWVSNTVSAYPLDYAALFKRCSRELPPLLDKGGQGWKWAVQEYGTIYAPDRMIQNRALATRVQTDFLEAAHLKGLTTGYALDRHGEIVALIVLGANRRSELLLREHGPEVKRLCDVMGKTVSTAIDIATELGYVPTGRFHRIFRLSPRERQIAQLAAEGFSTLNIGMRLGISENTVHVHLNHVYRKLDIHSRVDLVRCLLASPLAR